MKTFKEKILVDDADYDFLKSYSWCISVNRYAVARDKSTGKVIYMHKLLLGNSGGRVDHEDGNGLNNQRSNLRLCSNAENSRNQKIRSNNTSGYKGVSWDSRRKKWHAYIRVNYKRRHLGYFDKIEEARDAYRRGAIRYHQEFARFA